MTALTQDGWYLIKMLSLGLLRLYLEMLRIEDRAFYVQNTCSPIELLPWSSNIIACSHCYKFPRHNNMGITLLSNILYVKPAEGLKKSMFIPEKLYNARSVH